MTALESNLAEMRLSKITLLFFCCALVGSCALFKREKGPGTEVPPDKKKEPPKETVEKDTVKTEPEVTVKDTFDLTHYLKEEYSAALILPFHLDSIDTHPLGATDEGIPDRSLMAIEFYEGALLAVDDLERSGLNLKLHVYDSENHVIELQRILRDRELKDMDLIIGPVYNNNLRIAADFARKHRIPLVSPLSPSRNITTGNPWFIMANPSVETHIGELFDFIAENHKNAIHWLVYPNRSVEIATAQQFKTLADSYNAEHADTAYTTSPRSFPYVKKTPRPPIDFSEIVFFEDEKIELDSYFTDSSARHVIVIPSFDAAFVSQVYRELYPLRTDFNITVIGMPSWDRMESLRLDYLLDTLMNTHLSSAYFIENDTAPAFLNFRNRYFNTVKTEPSRNAVIGHDLALFFGEMLRQYGTLMRDSVQGKTQPALHTTFQFRPNFTYPANDPEQQQVDYLENKYVHILKYADFQLKKLNH